MFFEDGGKIAAYPRSFVKEEGVVQVGRALTIQRGTGLDGTLFRQGSRQTWHKQHPNRIYIEAQVHAIGFCECEGVCHLRR